MSLFSTIFSSDFYSTTKFFKQFENIRRFKAVNYGTSLAWFTAIVIQSDFILPELQQQSV